MRADSPLQAVSLHYDGEKSPHADTVIRGTILSTPVAASSRRRRADIYHVSPQGQSASGKILSQRADLRQAIRSSRPDAAASGPRHLLRDDVAEIVAESFFHHHECGHFTLHQWVIMANHVHIQVTPRVGVPVFMRSLKGYTAREANRVLGISGPFWQEESYDRLVRDRDEFGRIGQYIEMNPVRAGIVSNPEDYRWSSAYRGAG